MAIEIGSQVHWLHRVQMGSSLNLSRRDGTVTNLDKGLATVKPKRGRAVFIEVKRLREAGQQSELDELMRGKQTPVAVVAQEA